MRVGLCFGSGGCFVGVGVDVGYLCSSWSLVLGVGFCCGRLDYFYWKVDFTLLSGTKEDIL